ncbi:MAG: hypothetical protein KGJ23_00560 [Euryarchaeota archaeon]|nr:hypothetical protein [Euryarchaeota archaeon]MDE1835088.1 hypothetical protein [Euryarchaeota archaeon]MDE1879360.1 hypothetical protein [Euryarchaeota archaeon]MDE2044949.1 hypothetical protein [Thermoplasmata archaeon]
MRSTTTFRPAMRWMIEADGRGSELREGRSWPQTTRASAPRDVEPAFRELMREIEGLQDRTRLNLEMIRLEIGNGKAPGPRDRSRERPQPR